MGIDKFDENSSDPLLVGQIDIEKVKKLTGIVFKEQKVFIYPGAVKHIKKKHSLVWDQHKQELPSLLSSPDYIGKNPKVPNSIELYKLVGDHLLLAIKLDPSGYLFVSSFYDLDNAEYKIKKRLASGRIQPYK